MEGTTKGADLSDRVKEFPNGAWGRWIRFGLSSLILPVLVFIWHIDRRVVRIESTRLDMEDGKEIVALIGREALIAQQPSPELVQAVKKLEEEVIRLRTRLEKFIEEQKR
jgi:hypothetical protein